MRARGIDAETSRTLQVVSRSNEEKRLWGSISLLPIQTQSIRPQVQAWISSFNSLPGAQVFLNIPGRPGGNIVITDNPASPSLTPENQAKIERLLPEGLHGLNQQSGGKNVEFLNPNSPDGKDPLNVLAHEIGHMKWPGLGNDDRGHDPLFYKLLNDSLKALGLPVDEHLDLQDVDINGVVSPAGSDPLHYNITKSGRSPLVSPEVDPRTRTKR